MLRFVIFTLLWFSFGYTCFSQSSIDFNASINNKKLQIDSSYSINDEQIIISKLQFYVSNIQNDSNYYLIDFSQPKTRAIKTKSTNSFEFINFNLGIDSITNVSGAFGGDLDPTNGMYWTWQSGYINFKLEGTYSACPARNNFFQFHIGGYQYPFNSIQNIELKNVSNKDLSINLNLNNILNQIDLTKEYQVMSPNENAMKIATIIAQSFQLSKND